MAIGSGQETAQAAVTHLVRRDLESLEPPGWPGRARARAKELCVKRAVSISLGNPARDKSVDVNLNGTMVRIERIGTGGDVQRTRQLITELDGQVDALSLGGMDLYVRLEGRQYPIYAALKLVKGVKSTPVVDGRALKYVYEGRLFELLGDALGPKPHFHRAFMPFSIDRIGLAEAVSEVTDELVLGDLLFALGVPWTINGLDRFKRVARILMPFMSYLPLSMILPPGVEGEKHKPKAERLWREADLIVGDMHYIYTYSPTDLEGKTVITNTTTPDNIELLRERGVKTVVTTSPRYDGRSFGINTMEAALTAYAGLGRPLTDDELNNLIDEIGLKPWCQSL
jgi:hypothetical protein